MNYIKDLCELLEQKKVKFMEYEQVTHQLLECDADTAEDYIIKRFEIATEIDEITECIGKICDEQPNTELLMDISYARCNYERVAPELQIVYDLAQSVRSVAYRIVDEDNRVIEKLEKFKSEAMDKIKSNQNLPKIKKYLTDITQSGGASTLTSQKV